MSMTTEVLTVQREVNLMELNWYPQSHQLQQASSDPGRHPLEVMVRYCRSGTVTVSSRSAVSVYSRDPLDQPFQVIHEIKFIHLK